MADIIYRDLKKTFDKHPINNDVLTISNEMAVRDSIMNIIFTSPYERYRKAKFGAGIPADLFENLSPNTEYNVRNRIINAIENHEKRAELLEVSVRALYDQNAYNVRIVFRTKNSFEPVTIENILRRIR